MSMPSPRAERRHWAMTALLWLVDRFRPRLGWPIFCGAMFLVLMPAVAVRSAGWVDLRRAGITPEWVSLFGLAVPWLLIAYQKRLAPSALPQRMLLSVMLFGIWALAGILTVTQNLIHWLPSLWRLGQGLATQNWPALWAGIVADWISLGWRFSDWFGGVMGGGAMQDNVVFMAFILLILWGMAGLTAWLALQMEIGLLLALPSLWTLTLALYYGSNERYLLVVAMAVAVLLHLWLDHRTLEAEWQRRAIDFSPALIVDRVFVVLSITVAILIVALLAPSPTVDAAVHWAYRQLTPMYKPLETAGERLFPDLDRRPRGRYGVAGSGLPNRFMLGAGPSLSETPVMWVSTDHSGPVMGGGLYEEPPTRFYMRRATFADYTGSGWASTAGIQRQPYAARQSWLPDAWLHRAPLRQWVRTAQPTTLLYAAGEPAQAGLDSEVQARSPGDLVAFWVQGQAVTRYEAISSIPSVDDDLLRDWPGFDAETPVPEALVPHLQLPATVTERTRALAAQIVDGLAGPYERAVAIEAYLRRYVYDLDVEAPPPDVDVADYFLFELERGYCDYYATAFVVLARLAGLPTRFATGYVPGGWNPEAQEWLITEAEAHSWPEVYFPDLGWVPFEPTAGRSPLSRVRFDVERSSQPLPAAPSVPAVPPPTVFQWNWQMLLWLAPVAGLAVLFWRWYSNREVGDPWLLLTRWGRRMGRPLGVSETELEYGRELSNHLAVVGGEPEQVRRVSRSVLDLTEAVSEAHYGPDDLRRAASARAQERWQIVRRYR